MAEYKDREHYIPLRKSDLVDMLCRDLGTDRGAAQLFRQLGVLISGTFHYEYYKLLEELKDEYAPFDPDSVTEPIAALTPEQKDKKLARLFDRLLLLMERANFKRLSGEDVEKAMTEVSDWGVNMSVDMSIFERIEIFARGDTIAKRTIRHWPRIWKREEVRLPMYRRLVLFLKLKPSKRVSAEINTANVFLKAFKEIPKADLEMFLPGARMQMPGVQQLKLGGSLISGGAGVAYTIFGKIMGGLTLLMESPEICLGLAMALFGYGYKQYAGYQSTRNIFHLRLTQSLYYQTIGNNLGVLFHLLDEAEEQECREALLAYYYLWRYAGDAGWKAPDLDDYVEMDLERLAKLKVDFEIGDALAKLERLQLVTMNGDRYVAVPIDKALEVLDYAWDNYFKYNNEAQERAAKALGSGRG
jgi:Protein of unknown function (DUF3754)